MPQRQDARWTVVLLVAGCFGDPPMANPLTGTSTGGPAPTATASASSTAPTTAGTTTGRPGTTSSPSTSDGTTFDPTTTVTPTTFEPTTIMPPTTAATSIGPTTTPPTSGTDTGIVVTTGPPLCACGWNPASFYVCSAEFAFEEDPEGDFPYACPAGVGAGDACTMVAVTIEGCCTLGGDVLFCLDNNDGTLVSQVVCAEQPACF